MEVPPEKIKELLAWEKMNYPRKAKKLQARPQLTDYLQNYLDAFFELNRRRQYAMSALPLSIDAICLYADLYGYDQTIREKRHFFRLMSALDDGFLDYLAKKAEADKDAKDDMKEIRKDRASKK